MLKIKCDIKRQDLKRVTLYFVKSEWFSLTWSCGSRQRDTTSSGWKFKLNNLAVKGLKHANTILTWISAAKTSLLDVASSTVPFVALSDSVVESSDFSLCTSLLLIHRQLGCLLTKMNTLLGLHQCNNCANVTISNSSFCSEIVRRGCRWGYRMRSVLDWRAPGLQLQSGCSCSHCCCFWSGLVVLLRLCHLPF